MKNYSLKALGCALTFCFSTCAMSDGFYSGIGVIQNRTSGEAQEAVGTVSCDPANNVNVNIFGGYRKDLSKGVWLATEARWANGSGNTQDGSSAQPGYSASLKTNDTLEISVLPGIQITPDVGLYTRFGLAQLKQNSEDNYKGGRSATNTVDATVIGIGTNFSFSKNFSLRAEYQTMNIKDANFVFSDYKSNNNVKTKSSGFGIAGVYSF